MKSTTKGRPRKEKTMMTMRVENPRFFFISLRNPNASTVVSVNVFGVDAGVFARHSFLLVLYPRTRSPRRPRSKEKMRQAMMRGIDIWVRILSSRCCWWGWGKERSPNSSQSKGGIRYRQGWVMIQSFQKMFAKKCYQVAVVLFWWWSLLQGVLQKTITTECLGSHIGLSAYECSFLLV